MYLKDIGAYKGGAIVLDAELGATLQDEGNYSERALYEGSRSVIAMLNNPVCATAAGGCENECDPAGGPRLLDYEFEFSPSNRGTSSGTSSQSISGAKAFSKVSTVASLFKAGGSAGVHVEKLLGALLEVGESQGHTSVINAASSFFTKLNKVLGEAEGVVIWVAVKWKCCELVRCRIFWDRYAWKEHKDKWECPVSGNDIKRKKGGKQWSRGTGFDKDDKEGILKGKVECLKWAASEKVKCP